MSKLSSTQKKYIIHEINKQSGHGFFQDAGSFIKKVYENPTVQSIVKTVGPVVFDRFVKPYIEKKMRGDGLMLAGAGLKLAGQGKTRKSHLVKGSPEALAHMAKLRAMRKKK